MRFPWGYVQQSPWVTIANKQLELMGRYMTEVDMTPAARSRVAALDPRMEVPTIEFHTIYEERPRPCRDFPIGGDSCLTARRKVGLSL